MTGVAMVKSGRSVVEALAMMFLVYAALFGAAAAALLYFWRHSVLVTIVDGMAVHLPLHLVLGW
jgi:hypothetical protein